MYRVDPHLVAVTRWLEDLRHQTMDGTKICDDCLLYTDGNRCWHHFDLTEISDAQYFAHLITIFSTREQADRGAHVQYFNQVREWQVLYLHTPFEWY